MALTRDLRIEYLRPLLSPAILQEELPLTSACATTVAAGRDAVAAALRGDDRRLLCVVGPCSIHDPVAGREYGDRLLSLARALADDLLIVMRVYFEKPRTTVGWKGLINDPDLDGSFAINRGLRLARGLLRDLTALGLPCGCEFLDPISPQFTSDLVSWGAIGARTTESQVHRELASGLSMPVGFKNGTDGDVQIAIDAVRAAGHPHTFLGVTEQGLSAIVATRGNRDCHVILRGGGRGPNYDAPSVAAATTALAAAGLAPRLMVDASHGNSGKDPRRQGLVVADLCQQLREGSGAASGVMGIMLESFLVGGRQDLPPGGAAALRYGQSITDGCLGWDETVPLLQQLAAASRARRAYWR